jgi:hypothetical protein
MESQMTTLCNTKLNNSAAASIGMRIAIKSHEAQRRRCAMKILLAVDGSPCSDAAVREVARRPRPAGSRIRIISAVEPPFTITAEGWVPPDD